MGHIYRVSASVVSAATWIPSHSASFWSLVASQKLQNTAPHKIAFVVLVYSPHSLTAFQKLAYILTLSIGILLPCKRAVVSATAQTRNHSELTISLA